MFVAAIKPIQSRFKWVAGNRVGWVLVTLDMQVFGGSWEYS
jgi:hypothetical protein